MADETTSTTTTSTTVVPTTSTSTTTTTKLIEYLKLYSLDEFLDYSKIKKNDRFYYEKLWGTPFIKQSLKDWSDTSGIKF